jgi:hypothetical protein
MEIAALIIWSAVVINTSTTVIRKNKPWESSHQMEKNA